MQTIHKGDGFTGNKSIFTVRSFQEVDTSFKTISSLKQFAKDCNFTLHDYGIHVCNGRKCNVYLLPYTKTKFYFRKNKLVAKETWARVYYQERFYIPEWDGQMVRINQEVNTARDTDITNRAVWIGVELQKYEQGETNRENLSVDAQDILKMLEDRY